ncbi:MAG TPA: hypothetical protein VKU42_14235 [Candidatus Angelobacter sp.]|nr:hypothetical protein [Candidatus Angelobacter sp.]
MNAVRIRADCGKSRNKRLASAAGTAKASAKVRIATELQEDDFPNFATMTRIELKSKLEQAGIRAEAYSFDGGLPNEQYVISNEGNGRWETYYSERGGKTGLRSFNSETAACESFLEWLLKDHTTKRKL